MMQDHLDQPLVLAAGPAIIILAAGLTSVFADPSALAMAGHWPDLVVTFAASITDMGKSGWILVSSALIGIGGLVVRAKSQSTSMKNLAARIAGSTAMIFSSVAISGIIANALKRLIGRPRPYQAMHDGIWAFAPFGGARHESLPSGHATTLGALAASLAILYPRQALPILLAGAFLAFMRVLVSAHFPSDVVAGYGFGLWFAWLTSLWFKSRSIPFGRQPA